MLHYLLKSVKARRDAYWEALDQVEAVLAPALKGFFESLGVSRVEPYICEDDVPEHAMTVFWTPEGGESERVDVLGGSWVLLRDFPNALVEKLEFDASVAGFEAEIQKAKRFIPGGDVAAVADFLCENSLMFYLQDGEASLREMVLP